MNCLNTDSIHEMSASTVVVGGGIAGLASAIALAQTHEQAPLVLEQADNFSEVGAGVQLGPNGLHALQALGVPESAVLACAVQPDLIEVRAIEDAHVLTRMRLGEQVRERFQMPYVTIARADLHRLLLRRAQALGVELRTHMVVQSIQQIAGSSDIRDASEQTVSLVTHVGGSQPDKSQTLQKICYRSNLAVVANGVHTGLRGAVLPSAADGLCETGQWAFRATVPIDAVEPRWRQHVGVWWGKAMHVVHYPIESGQKLNLVVLLESTYARRVMEYASALEATAANADSTWSKSVQADALLHGMASASVVAPALRTMLHVPQSWGVWKLLDRDPDAACVKGAVALVGDAAHPMLPYLAQGAGMGLEDAVDLGEQLKRAQAYHQTIPQALQRFQQLRVQRNGRVQQMARRNAKVFHMSGLSAKARNMVLAMQGEELRMPWLYSWRPALTQPSFSDSVLHSTY